MRINRTTVSKLSPIQSNPTLSVPLLSLSLNLRTRQIATQLRYAREPAARARSTRFNRRRTGDVDRRRRRLEA